MATTTIFVSGANTGIGFEIAKKLLTDHENLHVFIGSRNLENGTKAVEELQTISHSSNKAEAIQLDLTSDSSIASCVSTVNTKAGHLDVLINNAGIAPMAANDDPATIKQAFNDGYNTNVTGTALLTDACVPLLSSSSQIPRIIFITSGMSSLTRVNATTYSGPRSTAYRPYIVSKCGTNMLAVTYGVQFREMGWKVNLVCPGLRKTKLNNFMANATDPALGALEAVKLAMDENKVVVGAKEKEEGRSGGMWDWDGTSVPW